jgi:hypothetical protein
VHSAVYRLSVPDAERLPGRIFRTCGHRRCVNPFHMRHPRSQGSGLGGVAAHLPKEKKLVPGSWRDGDAEIVKALERIAGALEGIAERTNS